MIIQKSDDQPVVINLDALPIITQIAVMELRKNHTHVYAAPWGERYTLKTIDAKPGTYKFGAIENKLHDLGYKLVIGPPSTEIRKAEYGKWDKH